MATVFEAFPKAIISDDWELGEIVENTEVGKIFSSKGLKQVIVDEADYGNLNASPSADTLTSDTLIYAMPSEMPGLNIARYISSYYWHQKSSDQYFEIVEVGVGKNQSRGIVEHIEFRVRPTDIAGVSDGGL